MTLDQVEPRPIRTCFAFNVHGTRCDMPAGHPGDHAVTTTWTDEECFEPGHSAPVPLAVASPAPQPPVEAGDVDIYAGREPDRYTESGVPIYDMEYVPGVQTDEDPNASCVACNHPYGRHNLEIGCLVGIDSENACGCHGFI